MFHIERSLKIKGNLPITVKAARAIVLGYLVAAMLAAAAVWLHGSFSSLPPEEASGGMAAFGDFVLFVAVFSVAAVPPTFQVLKLLVASTAFWVCWSILSLALTVLGLLASLQITMPTLMHADQNPNFAVAAPLLVLTAGPLAIAFLMSWYVSPVLRAKRIFLACAGLELLGASAATFKWVLGMAS